MKAERRTEAGRLDVAYVAHLARLHLTDDEIALFGEQLHSVLEHARELQALDVDDVEPTAHAMPVRNVPREDRVTPGLDREPVLANAPAARQELFIVPKIIE